MKLNVKVIGSGGIGTQFLSPACRVLNFGSVEYEFDSADVDVIDGDDFEERNRPRQNFRERGNKAEVTVEDLKQDYPDVNFRARPTYITDKNIHLLIEEGDIVFCCVDNHATRKLLSDHCGTLNDVTLVSGGNELTDGNIQIYRRVDGKDYTASLTEFHPEISEPDDENPGDIEEEKEEGCIEMVESAPQLLITNNFVAGLMLTALHNYLLDELDYDEVYFDINSGNVRRVYRTNEGGAVDLATQLQAKLAAKE